MTNLGLVQSIVYVLGWIMTNLDLGFKKYWFTYYIIILMALPFETDFKNIDMGVICSHDIRSWDFLNDLGSQAMSA